jgi:serine/threonine-protein kinase HipA
MSKPFNILEVRFHDGRTVGHLLHNGPIYFAYDPQWIKSGINLSPLSLPFTEKPFNNKAEGCEGVPGMIADSLPDAWGRQIAENVFARENWGRPTTFKLLAWIGGRGTGALSYHPPKTGTPVYIQRITTAALTLEAEQIERGTPNAIIPALQAGGTAGGAHPKAFVLEHQDKSLSTNREPASPDDIPSIIKLETKKQKGYPAAEQAFTKMAEAAGITTVKSKLIEDSTGGRHLLSQRFDFEHGKKKHMHSLSGLLHKPKGGMDYANLIQTAARLANPETITEIIRRMTFNLFAGNDDDHGRNHAFLLDNTTKTWDLTPAFDLCHTPGTLSRGLTILNEVRPPWKNVTEWLLTTGVPKTQIQEIHDQTREATSQWLKFAKQYGINKETASQINTSINNIAATVEPQISITNNWEPENPPNMGIQL